MAPGKWRERASVRGGGEQLAHRASAGPLWQSMTIARQQAFILLDHCLQQLLGPGRCRARLGVDSAGSGRPRCDRAYISAVGCQKPTLGRVNTVPIEIEFTAVF